MFISSRSYDALLTAYNKLLAQLTDAQNILHQEREATGKERKDLLDRILALSSPTAHAMVNPRLADPARLNQRPRMSNYPGYAPMAVQSQLSQIDLSAAMPKPDNGS